jgi:hypothetical protein
VLLTERGCGYRRVFERMLSESGDYRGIHQRRGGETLRRGRDGSSCVRKDLCGGGV